MTMPIGGTSAILAGKPSGGTVPGATAKVSQLAAVCTP